MPPSINTQFAIDMRIDQLVEWLVHRMPQAKMYENYQLEYKLSNAQFIADMSRARDRAKSYVEKDAEARFALALAAREDIINKARTKEDFGLALRAEQDLAELEGLYKQENKQPVVINLDWGNLPEADSDDGPVSDEDMAAYEKAVDDNKESE